MSGTPNARSLLNPWVLNLHKLGLELKCPVCLDLLCKPISLPCNHIFCYSCVPRLAQFECAVCRRRVMDLEINPAPHMENIVAIYRNLDAAFTSTVLPLLSADSGTKDSKKQNYASAANRVEYGNDLTRETVKSGVLHDKSYRFEMEGDNDVDLKKGDHITPVQSLMREFDAYMEELEGNEAPGLSPGSSPSGDNAKNTTHGNNTGIGNVSSEKYIVKGSSSGDNLVRAASGVDHTRELKRQKKLNYGTSEAVIQSHEHGQENISHSDQAVVQSDEEFKIKEETSTIVLYDASNVNGSICAFCHSSKITEGTGHMMHYADGKEVAQSEANFSNAVPVHKKCIDWTPKIYFEGETIKNLKSELARAAKLKCSSCKLKGAALGCYAKSCRRSYHVPCAYELEDCKWDCDNFLMLCPVHKSFKFPSEKSKSRKCDTEEKHVLSTKISPEPLNFSSTPPIWPQDLVFCGSSLSSEEKRLMVKLATISGATMYKNWNPNVTHVIAATDANGACSRTLKVLMAILNGRWVLTIDWVKACLEANHFMNEEPYELNLDNHGCRDGPRTGRLMQSNNAPKLFTGLSFYFNGEFVSSYKNDLLDLITVGGGTIFQSLEHVTSEKRENISTIFVVYNRDLPQGFTAGEVGSIIFNRLKDAENIAKDIDGHVIKHTWILESIAAARVLPY